MNFAHFQNGIYWNYVFLAIHPEKTKTEKQEYSIDHLLNLENHGSAYISINLFIF